MNGIKVVLFSVLIFISSNALSMDMKHSCCPYDMFRECISSKVSSSIYVSNSHALIRSLESNLSSSLYKFIISSDDMYAVVLHALKQKLNEEKIDITDIIDKEIMGNLSVVFTDERSPLFEAIRLDAAPELINLVLDAAEDKDALLSKKTSAGLLPLHCAVVGLNIDIIRTLLKASSTPAELIMLPDDRFSPQNALHFALNEQASVLENLERAAESKSEYREAAMDFAKYSRKAEKLKEIIELFKSYLPATKVLDPTVNE